MIFHLITIFPKIFSAYLNESILGRAQKDKKVEINIYNLREYVDPNDKRQTTDDTSFGGGPGMVMQVEPIYRCVESIKSKIKKQNNNKEKKILVLLTSAKGNLYNQQKAEKMKDKYTDVIMICGRYEGVDERVAEYIADEEISIGQYVLTGGELPAMVIVDSVTRLLDGVLGNKESLLSESYNLKDTDSSSSENYGETVSSFYSNEQFDYPVYTRPAEFNGWKVPEVLLSGNHKEIEEWRIQNANSK